MLRYLLGGDDLKKADGMFSREYIFFNDVQTHRWHTKKLTINKNYNQMLQHTKTLQT